MNKGDFRQVSIGVVRPDPVNARAASVAIDGVAPAVAVFREGEDGVSAIIISGVMRATVAAQMGDGTVRAQCQESGEMVKLRLDGDRWCIVPE